jgi:hypothetical protein
MQNQRRPQVSIRLRYRTVVLDLILQKIIAEQHADCILGRANEPRI